MQRQWPLKIQLAHPQAPFFQKASITIAADCVTVANPNIHKLFEEGKTLLTGCPLLENSDNLLRKLTSIVRYSNIREIAVYTMEVPCCLALHFMMDKALADNPSKKLKVSNHLVRVMTGRVEPFVKEAFQIDETMMKLEREAHKGLHT